MQLWVIIRVIVYISYLICFGTTIHHCVTSIISFFSGLICVINVGDLLPVGSQVTTICGEVFIFFRFFTRGHRRFKEFRGLNYLTYNASIAISSSILYGKEIVVTFFCPIVVYRQTYCYTYLAIK